MWKSEIKRQFPALIHPVRIARWLSYRWQYPAAARRIENAANGRVLAGPFKGIRYPTWQHPSHLELLGVYEHNLVPIIEEVIARFPETIIHVGTAYGYYALGLARRVPAARVIAYESDITRVKLLEKFSALNAVTKRVRIRGECTSAELARDLAKYPRAFILMDVEGGESTLLSSELTRKFTQAELLIELHEMSVPGVTKLLQGRFAATHQQELIRETQFPLDSLDLSVWGLDDLDRSELAALLDERRGEQMAWLHLKPHRSVV